MASLLAFESAARHANFTLAAAELHLTQSAISQQVRQLEKFLGFSLFERTRKRVLLTDSGLRYFREIEPILGALSESTSQAMASGGAKILNFAVLPSFGARWLMPRIVSFFENNPEIEVNFHSYTEPFDLDAEKMDAAIHYGEPTWPGTFASHIVDDDAVPVASPAYVREHGITRPQDLVNARLLQEFSRMSAWAEWFETVKVSCENPYRGPRFDNFSMSCEAAKAGLGVALIPRFLCEADVQKGALCEVFPHAISSHLSYYLVYTKRYNEVPAILALRRWLDSVKAEAMNSGARHAATDGTAHA